MDSEGDATGALRELSAKGHGCFRPQGLFHELGGSPRNRGLGAVAGAKANLRVCATAGFGGRRKPKCSVDENFPPTSVGFVFAQRWEYRQYHFIEASRC